MTQNSLLNPDVCSGLLFVGLGAAFFWLGRGYDFGSTLSMGPGFFPAVLSVLLVAVGLVIAAKGIARRAGPVGIAIGPSVRVLGAVGLFAAFVQPVGSSVILPAMVLLAASASRHFRWRTAVPLAVALTVCSDLIFRVGLDLPLPAFGAWLGD